MFDLAASDPVDLQTGDTLSTANEIRRGAVVCFERTAPDRVDMRALSSDEQRTYSGALYVIDRGETPGTLVLKRHTPA